LPPTPTDEAGADEHEIRSASPQRFDQPAVVPNGREWPQMAPAMDRGDSESGAEL